MFKFFKRWYWRSVRRFRKQLQNMPKEYHDNLMDSLWSSGTSPMMNITKDLPKEANMRPLKLPLLAFYVPPDERIAIIQFNISEAIRRKSD